MKRGLSEVYLGFKAKNEVLSNLELYCQFNNMLIFC